MFVRLFLFQKKLQIDCNRSKLDLSKQQELDTDPKSIQQISFTANLDRDENATMFFILKMQKKRFLNFHKEP